ncbi:hypothetical protein PMAYCL1PPCAC_24633, partial [Pristionchus mayeri]
MKGCLAARIIVQQFMRRNDNFSQLSTQSLLFYHLRVSSSSLHQFFVRSSLHYSTTLHETNLFTMPYRVQSMGNRNRCSTSRRSEKSLSNDLFTLSIQCTRCLI